ncbi:hypothetical protein HYU50_01105 [Candidatus Woesearchaeota archaeon]|nr:hypothetical protein [Candidatus Woesearchaeota archaeon]
MVLEKEVENAEPKNHKIFIGLTSVLILIIGLFFGTFLTAREVKIDEKSFKKP